MYLFFDTETTGLPKSYKAPPTALDNWPRLVQLSFLLYDGSAQLVRKTDFIIKPNGFEIPQDAVAKHGITTERALKEGIELKIALRALIAEINFAEVLIGHNIDFDFSTVFPELIRSWGIEKFKALQAEIISNRQYVCTMKMGMNVCKLPNKFGDEYKWPKLQELYVALFKEEFTDMHNSSADVKATAKCFFEMKRLGIIRL